MVLKPCPFCETLPERLKNLDFSDSEAFWHPDDVDCILAGCSIHRDTWEGWNTRVSSQAPSDDVVERITQSVLQTTWGYPGPSDPVVKSVREGVRAAIAASGEE
jgi:hypothetical protein